METLETNLRLKERRMKAITKKPIAKKELKKPMKVVYITNPIKFNISASKFRELVQELTGQDSELPLNPDPTKLSSDNNNRMVVNDTSTTNCTTAADDIRVDLLQTSQTDFVCDVTLDDDEVVLIPGDFSELMRSSFLIESRSQDVVSTNDHQAAIR